MISLKKLFKKQKKESVGEEIKRRYGTESWNYRLWRFRKQKNKSRISSTFINKQVPEITQAGMYWFFDDSGKTWLVAVREQGAKLKSQMLEAGSLIVKEVDSIGFGEFIYVRPN